MPCSSHRLAGAGANEWHLTEPPVDDSSTKDEIVRLSQTSPLQSTGEGFFLDIALGIVGAVIRGWLFNLFGMHGVTGLNVYSLILAVIGAGVFLVVYHAIRRTV